MFVLIKYSVTFHIGIKRKIRGIREGMVFTCINNSKNNRRENDKTFSLCKNNRYAWDIIKVWNFETGYRERYSDRHQPPPHYSS